MDEFAGINVAHACGTGLLMVQGRRPRELLDRTQDGDAVLARKCRLHLLERRVACPPVWRLLCLRQ
jgi:hypothetical protein